MANLKYIGIFLICILLLFTFEWKTSTLSNYLEARFTKDYKEAITKLEKDKESYTKEMVSLNSALSNIRIEKNKLVKDKEGLNLTIIALNDQIIELFIKKEDIKTPGDKNEASKILNSFGYTNTILQCQ